MTTVDFIFSLESLMESWTPGTNRTITEIAERTATDLALVIDAFARGMAPDIEVTDSVTREQALGVWEFMRAEMRPQVELRLAELERKRQVAAQAFDLTMERLRVLQVTKNWHAAYRTLSYYFGEYGADISPEMTATVAGEALRLGAKANANFQELVQWFKKGLHALTRGGSESNLEEAIDFIDAYGDLFLQDSSGKSVLVLQAAVGSLWREIADDRLRQALSTVAQGFDLPISA